MKADIKLATVYVELQLERHCRSAFEEYVLCKDKYDGVMAIQWNWN